MIEYKYEHSKKGICGGVKISLKHQFVKHWDVTFHEPTHGQANWHWVTADGKDSIIKQIKKLDRIALLVT